MNNPAVSSIPIDHIAVPAADVGVAVEWYVREFAAKILYQDKTWAFLQCGPVKLAIVSPRQHPPHVAFAVSPEQLALAAQQHGKPIDQHRDGTTGIYIADPFGNSVELICYPPGKTIYG